MPKEDKQIKLFDIPEWWEEHWQDMPEFVQEDLTPFKTIYIHFETREDLEAFRSLIGQRITTETQSIWYPAAEIGRYRNKLYVDEGNEP